jgi:hypothetical protein
VIGAQHPGVTGTRCRLHLPREPLLEAALAEHTAQVEYQMGGDCMVRAVAADNDARLLDSLPVAPGAVLWALDDF